MGKLSRDGSGIVQDIFKSYFLSVVHAAGVFFFQKIWISGFLGHAELGEMTLLPIFCISALLGPQKTSKKTKTLLRAHQAKLCANTVPR